MKKLSFKVLSNRVMVTLLLISITRIYTQTVIISKPVLLNHSAHLYRKPLFFVIIAPFEGTHKVDVSSGENEFDTPALYEHMAFSHGLLKKKNKKNHLPRCRGSI